MANSPQKAAVPKDKSLESWIWDAACSIRGAKDAPKYKDYILPLVFTKRLCDVFDDELNRIAAGAGFPGKSSADYPLLRRRSAVSLRFASEKVKADISARQCPSLRSRPAESLRCAPISEIADSAWQWGWVQHMHASLNDKGRAAVVLDTGAASRGSGNAGTNKEKTVRQWFVDHDLIESVLYLPEPSGASQTARQGSPQGERGGANQNLFYNTTAPAILLFLNRVKPKARQGQVLLVNASQHFEKGNTKNYISEGSIRKISDTLIHWKEEETAWRESASQKSEGKPQVTSEARNKLSRIVDHAELEKNDYNISPSRYIHTSDAETYRPIAEIVEKLDSVEAEARETDKALRKILKQLGV